MTPWQLGRGSDFRRRRWALLALSAFGAFAIQVRCGPLPEGLLAPGPRTSTEVVDRRGEPLYEALSAQGGRSRPLSALALPRTLVSATLAAEDHRFFLHPGVDPVAAARAAWHDLRARRIVEGASTITQQAVKLLTGRPRTWAGKIEEIVLALRVEHRLSKAEILALYLSIAPYGNQYVGAQAAARGYFGVDAESLTPAQAAFLAGLPQRPGDLDPRRGDAADGPGALVPEGTPARARQLRVLARMEALGLLSPADAAHARAERLVLRHDERAFLAPHFVERVRGEAGPARRIETTLDARAQRTVRGILSAHRARLDAHGAHNVAVVAVENATGEVLAWEGSGDWADADHGGAIDGAASPRQPGSALKPFTYALAFEQGETPATVLPDVPSHFPTAEPGVLYAPRNYDGAFRGPLRARLALAGSENVPAVYLLSRAGVPDLLRLLRRAGLTTLDRTPDYYGYGLTMGDAEVRLDEVVGAYAALARGGVFRPLERIRAVVAPDGTRRPRPARPEERILSERTAFHVADILSDPQARAFAFGRGGSLELPFPAAVKTGTSQAYHDNWTVGFTRDLTVGVWVGNFDRTPLRGSTGVTGAAPILHDVLVALQEARGLPPEDRPVLDVPLGLVKTPVCALSGLAPVAACPRIESEWLDAGRALPSCTWHRLAGGRRVVAWPPVYRPWARERGLYDARAFAAPSTRTAAAPRHPVAPPPDLLILNPPDGARYLLDPTLRAAFQTLPLRVATDSPAARLTWRVDGTMVGVSKGDEALDWPLHPGVHEVAVEDERGRRAQASFVVR